MDDRLPARHLIYVLPIALLGAFGVMAFIGHAIDTASVYREQQAGCLIRAENAMQARKCD